MAVKGTHETSGSVSTEETEEEKKKRIAEEKKKKEEEERRQEEERKRQEEERRKEEIRKKEEAAMEKAAFDHLNMTSTDFSKFLSARIASSASTCLPSACSGDISI